MPVKARVEKYQAANKQGYNAFFQARKLEDNPYPTSRTGRWMAWRRGFQAGINEAEKRKIEPDLFPV